MGLLEQIFIPISRDKFARRILRAVKKEDPHAEVRFDPTECSVIRGPDNKIFLGNAYEEYCRAPLFKRKRVIAFYAAMQQSSESQIPDNFVAAEAHILPKVRERYYHEALQFIAPGKGGKTPDVAFQLLNEHLTIELVYDTPKSMALIPREQLGKWQMDFDAVMKTARNNLWKISNENWLQPHPGLFVAPWTDFHNASRLFLHDLIWQLPVHGAHVAMIPNRNRLFVAGDKDAAALKVMASLVEKEFSEPLFMTAMAFRLNNSQWEPFLPHIASPVYTKYRELQIKSMGQMYAEQKQLLERTFTQAKHPDPPFVASFSGITSPAGELITFASWAKGAQTLLPDADSFSLGAKKGDKFERLGFIDITTAHREFSDLLEPTNYYPPRWQTKGFPSEDRLSRIALSPAPILRTI